MTDRLVDNVEEDEDLQWIGTTNELNGAYAADGYSRTTGAAFFVSTCGVGELSALNAFAGSYAEQVPVIHLVGVPSTRATKAGKIMHHTLGPNHSPETFPLMYKSCTVAQVLINERTTAEEIDGAIELCIRRNQPIYIALPQDLVNMPLPLVALDRKIDTRQPQNWAAVEEIVIDHIVKLLSDSKKAVILADAGAARDHAKGEVDLLVQTLKNVPVFTTAMGKGSINENIPNFAGVYCGNLSLESVEASFKSADLIIAIGLIETDMNTGMFTFNFDGQKVVELHAQYTLVRGGKFDQVGLKNMLPKLIEALAPLDIKSDVEIPGNLPLPRPLMSTDATKLVSYPFFWSQIEQWLRPNDIIFSEAGTCGFGILDVKLPPAATVSAQFLWASIGFGTAALCGAACANKGRVIGFLGDGAFMMSFQEISTMIRYHCSDVVLFLMNNSGYTVEKYLHGVDKKYNSVNSGWRFTDTLHYFGGDRESSWCVNNEQMLVDLLRHPNFLDRKGIKFVEVKLPEMEGGRLLTLLAQRTGRWDGERPVDANEFGQVLSQRPPPSQTSKRVAEEGKDHFPIKYHKSDRSSTIAS